MLAVAQTGDQMLRVMIQNVINFLHIRNHFSITFSYSPALLTTYQIKTTKIKSDINEEINQVQVALCLPVGRKPEERPRQTPRR